MSLIKIILTKVSGSFDANANDRQIDLEWLVFSNNLRDFAAQIAVQETVNSMIDSNGNAAGWLAPGAPYILGNDSIPTSYAGKVDVSNRKIIDGNDNYNINVHGQNVTITPNSPSGTVQWTVKQSFAKGNEKDEQDDDGNNTNKITIKTNIETEEELFLRDKRTGQLVLNSAGQFFNPPPAAKRKTVSYSVTRKERGNPLTKSKTYSNTVNADAWYGAAAGTVLMESIACNFDGEQWDVTYNFKEDANGFQTLLLDTGYEELIDGKLKKILDDEGVPITEPAKLNGSGQKLSGNNQGYNLGPFWKYTAMPFSSLSLPNPFSVVSVPPENH